MHSLTTTHCAPDPTHYAAWNVFGCPGVQMDEGYQDRRGCSKRCFHLWLCFRRLLCVVPALLALAFAIVSSPQTIFL